MITRELNAKENLLIRHLLFLANDSRAELTLPNLVYVLEDGEMGSIKFTNNTDRMHGKNIVSVEYSDLDNILVLITLSEDQAGELFELDFWKTDFTKLVRYPSPEEVKLFNDN